MVEAAAVAVALAGAAMPPCLGGRSQIEAKEDATSRGGHYREGRGGHYRVKDKDDRALSPPPRGPFASTSTAAP